MAWERSWSTGRLPSYKGFWIAAFGFFGFASLNAGALLGVVAIDFVVIDFVVVDRVLGIWVGQAVKHVLDFFDKPRLRQD